MLRMVAMQILLEKHYSLSDTSLLKLSRADFNRTLLLHVVLVLMYKEQFMLCTCQTLVTCRDSDQSHYVTLYFCTLVECSGFILRLQELFRKLVCS